MRSRADQGSAPTRRAAILEHMLRLPPLGAAPCWWWGIRPTRWRNPCGLAIFSSGLRFATQPEARGTADAVRCALPALPEEPPTNLARC